MTLRPGKPRHSLRPRARWLCPRLCLWAALLSLFAAPALAQTPISLYRSFAGNIDYTGTAGTLRAQPNTGDACALNATSAGLLNTLPVGATVRAAYLYWAGSGSTVDAAVTLNGQAVNAGLPPGRTFTENYAGTYDFFSGFADVTAQVAASGNATYTFAGLSVDNGAPYCGVQAVVAGWGMLVVYEAAAEPLRVINVFDGFQAFRGSAITLVPNNFQIPATGIDGRNGVLTWEGDVQNSATFNGFTENVVFNGAALTDAQNPLNNQYNSTTNLLGLNNTYGVDFDVYDITAQLNAGDTSANSVYSSGADLVLLSMEAISVTNTPVAELAISKSFSGDMVVGPGNVYAIDVINNGPSANAGAVTVTDTLPAGLSLSAGTGSNWSCGAAGQDVTCTHPGPLAAGASLPTLSLEVSARTAAMPSVSNTASVTGSEFDHIGANNTSTAVSNVLQSDFSTSAKTVLDLNGADADPGDTLRYTITLTESAGAPATAIAVSDDIPANVNSFTVVSLPPGAVDNSTGAGTGANGNGLLDIGNIDIAASASATIVFEVLVSTVAPGTVISNTANVTVPNGIGAAPAAPDVIVSASAAGASGNKPLYLYSTPALDLSRIPAPAPQPNVRLRANNGPTATWTLTPLTQLPLTIDSSGGVIPVVLYLRKGNTSASTVTRSVQVALSASGATAGPIGTPLTLTLGLTGTPQPFTFNLPLAANSTLAAGSAIDLTVSNVSGGGGSQTLRVFPEFGGNNSQVILPSLTVINVDSLQFFDAAYAGGNAIASENPDNTVFVRTVVSDPFGSFDISNALLTLTDALGSPVLNNAPMTLVNDSGAATRTYETSYYLPPAAPVGAWSAQVIANEGTEGNVSHQRSTALSVGQPNLLVLKSQRVSSDPVNGSAGPFSIPGATIIYTLAPSNQGTGPADSIVITDPIAASTALFVGDFDGAGSPVLFNRQSSGLDFNFVALGDAGDDVDFADVNGFGYVPVPDADGYDPAVRQIRISPRGQFEGGAAPTGLTIEFQVRVQ